MSLTPNTTEALFALDAGQMLVGRSRYCDFPASVQALPVVGGYVDPSLEAILGLRPDLVVGARGPAGKGLADRLEARGLRTFFPPSESVDQIKDMIQGLGKLLGREPQATQVMRDIDAKLAQVAQAVASRPSPKVLLVFGLSPTVVAGPGSFADEMIRRAGGANALQSGVAYPVLDMEAILGLEPDVVLDAAALGGEEGRIDARRPGWAELRAVREGRVTAILDEAVLRPGPRVAEGVAVIAKILHPDVVLP